MEDLEKMDNLFQKELMNDFIEIENQEIENIVARYNYQKDNNNDEDDDLLIPLSNEFMEELLTNLEIIKLNELGNEKNKEYNRVRMMYYFNDIKTYFDRFLFGGITIFELYTIYSMQYNNIPYINIYISTFIYPIFDYCLFLIKKNKDIKNDPTIDKLLKSLVTVVALSGILYVTINYLDKENLEFLKSIFLYPLLKNSYNLIKNDNIQYYDLCDRLNDLKMEIDKIDTEENEKIKILKDDRIYMDILFGQD